ncbi:MAG: winged helix-turn-helix transcriptional regulator [Candidatus Brockarchaeota archaeon]|nr:winged helix-turn-helix transcriptional regulator [Candidatus Brockarchaeota archaeon]MBO3841477.1 winged helix-turn-helix transcriptional regulator [Candidatus Brockarchaeota archaeon]
MTRTGKAQEVFKARVFEAFSDPARLKIVDFLRDGGKCVSEIAEKTGILQPSVSRHLKILKECGIVKESKLGSKRVYRITDPRIFRIVDSLDPRLEESLKKQIYESII